MKPEIKAMWVDALRSGDYPQTRNSLQDSDGFCCLGVLCDLYLKENPNSGAGWDNTQSSKGEKIFVYTDEHGQGVVADEYLPEPVVKWSGLPNDNPAAVWEGLNFLNLDEAPLSRINDESGCSFQEIANIIEQNFPKLWRGSCSRGTSLSEQIQEDIISFAHSSDPPRLTQSELDSLCEIVSRRFSEVSNPKSND